VIKLNPLSENEILELLQRLADIHAINYGYDRKLTDNQLKEFVQEIVGRLGAEALLTPGEIVRDFISVLNILYQNQKMTLADLIKGSNFKPTAASKTSILDEEEEDIAQFSL
jgi:hypothetical protein